ncbi:serine/threonine protein kinase [Streptomyces sp. NRRL F-4489]|uniref:serine/threonine-protein kinase n=1 Tax=Streptomyces sp. NRRL F-4489 TaxID=1609095 RepID=UPI00074AA546|nr:serine/threonine-protein kinase [Streptomyces sp. NRRL F-4489]KUL51002.1 serine/threonine protein kinase [Streptomyces sp. NRRL F-4489]
MAERDGGRCQRRECAGHYEDVGGGELYCDVCGLAPVVSARGLLSATATVLTRPVDIGGATVAAPPPSGARARGTAGTHVPGQPARGRSASGPGRRPVVRGTGGGPASASGSGSGASHGRLGAGLVAVPQVAPRDPRSVVLERPEVPERKRFCSRGECGAPVGRGRDGRPGEAEGFCTKCGHPYSFVPKLRPGELVHGQYEVAGCLAHGGLGWIYLARDRAVDDRWVVLKGLLDTGDEEALAAAVSERRFLAAIEHPNIVRIYNFVEHLDGSTGSRDGYIVMEYVGGTSLKDVANERRTAQGRRDPMPVEQACAYGIEALEALGHLHARQLLYCDFKVDNAIQQHDRLKLIDLGAVRRMDDHVSPVYGTIGYQAPEVGEVGPSVASDLYTVARTLAVLTFDFQGYTNVFADCLPDPEHIEVFRRYESFYRLLVRATDPDPGRRFGSAQEMAEQLTGVLREVVALRTGEPRPAPSTLFGPELRVVGTELIPPLTGDASLLGARRAGRRRPRREAADEPGPGPGPGEPLLRPLDAAGAALALPVPLPDPDDPGAGFLAGLHAASSAELLAALRAAPDSPEVRLRALRARLELGAGGPPGGTGADGQVPGPGPYAGAAAGPYADVATDPAPLTDPYADVAKGPAPELDPYADGDGDDGDEDGPGAGDWRVVWHRGLAALVAGDHEGAALAFDAVYDAFPGEPAPKLALGLAAELLGQPATAAECYRLVWATDRGYVSAAFGLARVRLAAGDRAGAVAALESVPESSIHYTAARAAAVRARLRHRSPREPLLPDLRAAAQQVEALAEFGLDDRRRAQLATEVLGTALDWVLSGGHGDGPGTPGRTPGGAPDGTPGGTPPGIPGGAPDGVGDGGGPDGASGPASARQRPVLLGSPLDERGLRFGLERSYRLLARLAQRGEERIELVERANRFRPRTWV